MDPIDPFSVLVRSGQDFSCTRICQGVSIVLQGHVFVLELFMFGLHGAYVILGA